VQNREVLRLQIDGSRLRLLELVHNSTKFVSEGRFNALGVAKSGGIGKDTPWYEKCPGGGAR
jgi:hypothetical protein